MAKRQEITIDKTEDRNKAVDTVAAPETKQGYFKVYLYRGAGNTWVFPETAEFFEIISPTGGKRTARKNAKRLEFRNGVAESTDPEIEKIARKHPAWTRDYCFHPKYLPVDATEREIKCAEELSRIHEDHREEMVRRMEAAKYFDKEAHPENGVPEPIDPETGKPDPVSEW